MDMITEAVEKAGYAFLTTAESDIRTLLSNACVNKGYCREEYMLGSGWAACFWTNVALAADPTYVDACIRPAVLRLSSRWWPVHFEKALQVAENIQTLFMTILSFPSYLHSSERLYAKHSPRNVR
jgi:hypothetical protein